MMRVATITFYHASEPLFSLEDPLPTSANAGDMLCYDGAFYTPQGDLHLVAFPSFLTKHGRQGSGQPTTERWRSCGFTLARVGNNLAESFGYDFRNGNPAGWITFQHPIDYDGAENYAAFQAVTAKQYMASSTREEAVKLACGTLINVIPVRGLNRHGPGRGRQ